MQPPRHTDYTYTFTQGPYTYFITVFYFFYLKKPMWDLESAERPLISRFRCWNGSNRSSAVLFVYPMPEKKELGNASTLGHVVPYTNRVNVRKEMSSITIGAIWSWGPTSKYGVAICLEWPVPLSIRVIFYFAGMAKLKSRFLLRLEVSKSF